MYRLSRYPVSMPRAFPPLANPPTHECGIGMPSDDSPPALSTLGPGPTVTTEPWGHIHLLSSWSADAVVRLSVKFQICPQNSPPQNSMPSKSEMGLHFTLVTFPNFAPEFEGLKFGAQNPRVRLLNSGISKPQILTLASDSGPIRSSSYR